MSADGKKLLVAQGRQLVIVDAAAGAKPAPVSTNGMNVEIDPREEWKQLFTDAWRIERDFFYDPHMHGVNWSAIRSQYEKMLEDCASREDVGYVISEMISEMNVGHAYYRGGDPGRDQRPSAGSLGCEFAREQDAYKIAKFYEGAAWDVDARNPLRQAGVKEGEYPVGGQPRAAGHGSRSVGRHAGIGGPDRRPDGQQPAEERQGRPGCRDHAPGERHGAAVPAVDRKQSQVRRREDGRPRRLRLRARHRARTARTICIASSTARSTRRP